MVGRLVAVAASYKPAHLGARLSTRDMEDQTMVAETRIPEPEPKPAPPEPEPEPITLAQVTGVVRHEMTALQRNLAEMGGTRQADAWAALRDMHDLGQLAQAALAGGELRDVLRRALADQVMSANPGVTTPGVIQDIAGLFTRSRPAVEAWGRVALADGAGLNVEWPIFSTSLATIVGEQATQKTEITSVVVPLTKGSAALKTYAGGSDVAYQLIRRSSPSYLAALERIYLQAYAVVTDAAFLAAMQTAGPAASIVINWTTATQAQMQEAAFTASAMIQDVTGAPAQFVFVPLAVFTRIGGVLNPPPVFNTVGTASAAQLAPTLSGLRVLYHPGVAAGTAIFSNDAAGDWHEDGPFLVTDDDVAKLGLNVAVWGMGAAAAYIPAAIVKTKAA
jgi:hypothetical protein